LTSELTAIAGFDLIQKPLTGHNRKADLQGWGIFGRVGFGDNDTNPFNTSIAIGIGGRGIIPTRTNDEFGVGYFYNKNNRDLILEVVAGLDDNGQGVEAYYNLAITPATRLTFDVQWLESYQPDTDDSVVLNLRLLMTF
jgi:porin